MRLVTILRGHTPDRLGEINCTVLNKNKNNKKKKDTYNNKIISLTPKTHEYGKKMINVYLIIILSLKVLW